MRGFFNHEISGSATNFYCRREGTGDGRSWEVRLSADQASIIVSFTEDTRDPDDRIGPAPITGMAWVSIADS